MTVNNKPSDWPATVDTVHFWSPWEKTNEKPVCSTFNPKPLLIDGKSWFAVSRLAVDINCPMCLHALDALADAVDADKGGVE